MAIKKVNYSIIPYLYKKYEISIKHEGDYMYQNKNY